MSSQDEHEKTTVKSQAPEPEAPGKIKRVRELDGQSWKYIFRSTLNRFTENKTTDLAAGLTYFTVMAIFPAILALVSILQLVGQSDRVLPAILEMIRTTIPDQGTSDTVIGIVEGFLNSGGAGIALVLGILTALWSASGYVGAFSRASNTVYQVTEGRNGIKLKLQQVALTIGMVLGAVLVLIMLVMSGSVAEWVGNLIGLGATSVAVWKVLKWPLLLIVVILMVAVLYHFAPNVKQPRFRWISVGSICAVISAIIIGAVFGFYVSNFSNYNKTYGALAGVIILLLLIYIMNIVLLFGLTLDVEVERGRQLQSGMPAERELLLPPRSTEVTRKAKSKQDQLAKDGHAIRKDALEDGATPPSSPDSKAL